MRAKCLHAIDDSAAEGEDTPRIFSIRRGWPATVSSKRTNWKVSIISAANEHRVYVIEHARNLHHTRSRRNRDRLSAQGERDTVAPAAVTA